MTTLFISDLHLHPSRPEIIDCFLRFLAEHRGKADTIYILGDLFEAWLGDDDPEPAYLPVRTALKCCVASGTRILLMHGNRDFLIGAAFAEQTGCELISDPYRIELNGVSTLLMHGDTLCTDDHDYQRVRSTIRSEQWRQQVLSLSLRERLALAAQARERSLLSTQEKNNDIMDVNADEVRRVIATHKVSVLIHGHTHRPDSHRIDHKNGSATRIVLGDWYRHGQYFYVDGQCWESRRFD